MNYQKNIEILCKREKLDLSTLAENIKCDISDLFRPKPETLLLLADYFKLSVDVLLRAPLLKLDQIKSYPKKMLVMDVDGVMTDGKLYYSENGDEQKAFNAKDGIALKKLKNDKGVVIGMLSNSSNKNTIHKRKEILGLDFAEVGHNPKAATLKKICESYKINMKEVIYLGDDINDIEAMNLCGLIACPADAVNEVKKISHIILSKKGGEACVRELIDDYFF